MSTKWGHAPSYRHHKPSGRAFVVLKRRPIYLGKFDTPASRQAFARFTSLWHQLAAGERSLRARLTTADLQTPEAFDRFVAEQCPRVAAAGSPLVSTATPATLTILELVDRYWQHAEAFYRRHD